MTGIESALPKLHKEPTLKRINGNEKIKKLKTNTKGGNICVAVRVRPFLPFEEGNKKCVEVTHSDNGDSSDTIHLKGRSKSSFTFDAAFPHTSTQNDIYQSCVFPLVDACLDGYNATVLAYGQTGAGKTHTILGECKKINEGVDESEAGVIPRTLNQLFQRLNAFEADTESDPLVTNKYQVYVQFLEVYGEDIRDLLSTKDTNKPLSIRDGRGGSEPEVIGACEVQVSSADEALLCLTRGTLKRVTRATAMNSESSRSHAIMTVSVEQLSIVEGETQQTSAKMTKKSRFHFVDLAGSERAKRTGVTGQGLKEGININKGLLVLGNVISALGDPKKKGKSFVPYRDSKLTRLLRGSLGGNHKTLMIACVSPSISNAEETLNTLRYANRTKNIKNKAKANVDPGSELVKGLRDQLRMLASALLKCGDKTFPPEKLKELATGSDNNMPVLKPIQDDNEPCEPPDVIIEDSSPLKYIHAPQSCHDNCEEKEDLVHALNESKQKITSLQNEVECLKEELRETQDLLSINQYVSIGDANSTVLTINDDISLVSNATYDTTKLIYEEKIARASADLKKKEKERDELALAIHAQESHVTRLFYVKESLSNELAKKQVRVESLIKERDEMKKYIMSNKQEKRKPWFLRALKNEIDYDHDELIRIEREIKNEEKECEKYVESVYEIKKENALINEWICDLTARIQDKDISIFELQHSVESHSNSSSSGDDHNSLPEQIRNLITRIKDLEDERSNFGTELEKLRNKSQKLEEKRDILSGTISDCKEKIRALKENHIGLAKEIGTVSIYSGKDVTREKTSDNCSKEIVDLSDCKKKKTKIISDISQCNYEITMITRELKNLSEELSNLSDVQGSSKTLLFDKTNEIMDMKSSLDEMKKRHDENFNSHDSFQIRDFNQSEEY